MASRLGPGAKRDPEAVLLVHIGGGWGHKSLSFRRKNPDVPGRLILQDLPIVLDEVESQGVPEGIELALYDFFTPQPVKGSFPPPLPTATMTFSYQQLTKRHQAARAYLMLNICHDFSDSDCQIILRNTAKSMERGYSKFLIGDYVLPSTNVPLEALTSDFIMMTYLGGIERTRRQWETLLDSCGLKIVEIWGGLRSSVPSVIEAELKG